MNEDATHKQAAAMAAKMANYRLHANCLAIPLLDYFVAEEPPNPQTIMVAKYDAFLEQLTSDGFVKKEEFEQRVQLIIENAKKFMAQHGQEDVDKCFMFYKDHNNGIFDFKVYVQDMILPMQGKQSIVRQFTAFFYEPRYSDLYQISLGVGPFQMPTETLKPGVVDLENDRITSILAEMFEIVLRDFRYK